MYLSQRSDFFPAGVRQEPDGRAQARLRRVQPVRHLRRELHPHLQGRGEGRVRILHRQVQAGIQVSVTEFDHTPLFSVENIQVLGIQITARAKHLPVIHTDV